MLKGLGQVSYSPSPQICRAGISTTVEEAGYTWYGQSVVGFVFE